METFISRALIKLGLRLHILILIKGTYSLNPNISKGQKNGELLIRFKKTFIDGVHTWTKSSYHLNTYTVLYMYLSLKLLYILLLST